MNANSAANKITVSWLDLVLTLLLIIWGAALWRAANRYTAWVHQYDKPLKETFEENSNVPLRCAEFAAIQKELEGIQARLLEEKMEALRLTAEIKAETKSIPEQTKREQESKSSEALLEHRIKLAAANAMISVLRSYATQRMQQ